MLLFVSFRLPHEAHEFLKSGARLCYTGAFSDLFHLCLGTWKCHGLVIKGSKYAGFTSKKKEKVNIIEIALKHLAPACVPSIILKIEHILGT